jgi:tetratricopeptide (TPR) repeat protein
LLEAKDISVQHGFDSFYKYVDVNLAYLYFSLQQWEKAQHYANLAINQNRQNEDKVNLGYSLSQLGRIKLATGENEYALKLFEEAIKVLETTDSKEATKKVYLRYAEALESMGRMQESTVFYRKVNDLVLV